MKKEEKERGKTTDKEKDLQMNLIWRLQNQGKDKK